MFDLSRKFVMEMVLKSAGREFIVTFIGFTVRISWGLGFDLKIIYRRVAANQTFGVLKFLNRIIVEALRTIRGPFLGFFGPIHLWYISKYWLLRHIFYTESNFKNPFLAEQFLKHHVSLRYSLKHNNFEWRIMRTTLMVNLFISVWERRKQWFSFKHKMWKGL